LPSWAFLGFHSVQAQIETPAPSPTATFSQKVGLTQVTIEYSRPSMKGRQIYGNLVPFGKLWRTGANMATKITFADDVKIAGNDLPAGTYAIFTIPNKDEWTVIFNKNANQGGTGNYKESEDALRVQVKPHTISDKIETFMINIEDVTPTSAVLELGWESTLVHVPMEVSIDERIMASIKRAMSPNPNDYFSAAVYYRESGKDLNQALEWIDECIKIHEGNGRNVFWIYRQKSLIQADMGKVKDAITTAKVSLAKAQEAGNDDYIKMNEDSISEWSKK
jgi:tetratricopeptide (TPR) repeat protein